MSWLLPPTDDVRDNRVEICNFTLNGSKFKASWERHNENTVIVYFQIEDVYHYNYYDDTLAPNSLLENKVALVSWLTKYFNILLGESKIDFLLEEKDFPQQKMYKDYPFDPVILHLDNGEKIYVASAKLAREFIEEVLSHINEKDTMTDVPPIELEEDTNYKIIPIKIHHRIDEMMREYFQ